MSAIRQGSMLFVKDVEFHTVEQQFKEAVFTHASTSPNQQLIASLDVARRQMELEGYGLVANAIEIALRHPSGGRNNPLISKYFRILGADEMVPAAIPRERLHRLSGAGHELGDIRRRACDDDEFCLDPTRMTLVCGTAGFDGTQFKGILANRLQHPGQQDLAQFRAVPVQHQQHPQRRRASDSGAGRDQRRDRSRPQSRAAPMRARRSRRGSRA